MLNQTFRELRLEKHPDKTFIGRIEKGFDFLGYHFSPDGLSVAEKTIEKFLARAVRLYEQEQGESFGSPLLGLYVKRWYVWVTAGFKSGCHTCEFPQISARDYSPGMDEIYMGGLKFSFATGSRRLLGLIKVR